MLTLLGLSLASPHRIFLMRFLMIAALLPLAASFASTPKPPYEPPEGLALIRDSYQFDNAEHPMTGLTSPPLTPPSPSPSPSPLVDDLCALVPNSTGGATAKICSDLSGVGLDELIYCGQEEEALLQLNDAEKEAAPLQPSNETEPSFTMREIMGSSDTEQAFNAVRDRCMGTSATRRQMAAWTNYGWCSLNPAFLLGKLPLVPSVKDTANYCDATTSEASWGRNTGASKCCREHDKCLTCEAADRTCSGSTYDGSFCDLQLAKCVSYGVHCCALRWRFGWKPPVLRCNRWGCSYSRPTWGWSVAWGCDLSCIVVSVAITGIMGTGLPNLLHTCRVAEPSPYNPVGGGKGSGGKGGGGKGRGG